MLQIKAQIDCTIILITIISFGGIISFTYICFDTKTETSFHCAFLQRFRVQMFLPFAFMFCLRYMVIRFSLFVFQIKQHLETSLTKQALAKTPYTRTTNFNRRSRELAPLNTPLLCTGRAFSQLFIVLILNKYILNIMCFGPFIKKKRDLLCFYHD